MQLSDILRIGFWVVLFCIALIRIAILRCPWKLFLSQLWTALPVMVVFVLLSALSGVAMGGSIGLIGNSIAGLLWALWFFLMWVPQRPNQS